MKKRNVVFRGIGIIVLTVVFNINLVFAQDMPLLEAPKADKDTVALWHFDEGNGSKILDSGTNNLNGHWEGNPKPVWIEGKFGKAIEFKPDSKGYIKVNDHDALDLTGELTVEAWIKPNDVSGRHYILNHGSCMVKTVNYSLSIWDGKLDFYMFGKEGKSQEVFSIGKHTIGKPIINAGEWAHVAATVDGTNITLYKNGEVVRQLAQIRTLQETDQDLYIGSLYKGMQMFDGIIDEVMISKKARSFSPLLVRSNNKNKNDFVENKISKSEDVGERPYDIITAGRNVSSHKELVDFEDLEGWKILCHNGAKAGAGRSREVRIWDNSVCKITFEKYCGYVELLPPHPIPIQDSFDSVEIWVYSKLSKNYGKEGEIEIIVQDAGNEFHNVIMSPLIGENWRLYHKMYLPHRWRGEGGGKTFKSWDGDKNGEIDFPAKLTSIIVRTGGESQQKGSLKKTVYLDSLSFYKEKSKLDIPKLVKSGKFPTTEDTILPGCAKRYINKVEQEELVYKFIYEGDDGRLVYLYAPKDGTLSDIQVSWKDKKPFNTNLEGGIVIGKQFADIAPGNEEIKARLISQILDNEILYTKWAWKIGDEVIQHTLSLQIKGKSLIADVKSDSGKAIEFKVGRVKGLNNLRLIKVPYLGISGQDCRYAAGPHVVYGDGLFVLSLIDWYNSNCSVLYGDSKLISDNEAIYSGGTRYQRKTDGSYNNLAERLFITVSPDFQEVLPNIPNPPSPYLELASKYVCNWTGGGASRPGYWGTLKKYGLDHIMTWHHGEQWMSFEEIPNRCGFFCDTVRPDYGDKRMSEYSEYVRSLGYIFGMFLGYTEIGTNSKYWNEDIIARNQDGSMKLNYHWQCNYNVRPPYDYLLSKKLTKIVGRKFHTGICYFDIHTNINPSYFIDYDARVPDAAMMKAIFNSWGELFLEAKKNIGIVVSEGRMRWMFAGLTDGDFATIFFPEKPFEEPLLVDFDLLKLHPLQFGIGMASFAGLFFGKGWGEGADDIFVDNKGRDIYFDKYITATIAYGHQGMIPLLATPWEFSARIKYYCMFQQLQKYYIADQVESIEYSDGKNFYSTSEAIAKDIYKESRLHIRYKNGLEMYINYGSKEQWKVTLFGREYSLPEAGFVAGKKGEILEYSALVDGHKIDYVDSPEYIYIDTRDNLIKFPNLGSIKGSVLIKKNENMIEIIPVGDLRMKLDYVPEVLNRDCVGVDPGPQRGCYELSLNLKAVLSNYQPGREIKVTAYNEEGEPRKFLCPVENGILKLSPKTEYQKYIVEINL
ncbi:LamG domain-containing protein [bacterium]|nr:LamG domain-containing protein [bacterium]